METKSTDRYKYCNHHHELTSEHEIVDFGDGKFVANKKMIPLLKALSELGLRTRTHHYINNNGVSFVGIIMDNMALEIKTVFEGDTDRTKYNGKKELLILWNQQNSNPSSKKSMDEVK